MIQIILLIIAGFALGLLCRKGQPKVVKHLITVVIWVLLLFLGIEVGSNDRLFDSLAIFGVKALVIALAATLGSILAAYGLWRWIGNKKQ